MTTVATEHAGLTSGYPLRARLDKPVGGVAEVFGSVNALVLGLLAARKQTSPVARYAVVALLVLLAAAVLTLSAHPSWVPAVDHVLSRDEFGLGAAGGSW